jgi:hypothetical protein
MVEVNLVDKGTFVDKDLSKSSRHCEKYPNEHTRTHLLGSRYNFRERKECVGVGLRVVCP